MGATVLVIWSKTLKSFRQWTLIRVPLFSPSPLCPVLAFKVMISLIPASPNHSLFALPPGGLSPPSQASVRKFWFNILSRLDLDPTSHASHCFRCSGASFTFNNKIQLQSTIIHGTWTSNAVHCYISAYF